MPSDTPLDLASLDPRVWRVGVGEEIYGPYTIGQLRGLAEEGRLTSASRIAGKDVVFAPAESHAALAGLFPEQSAEQGNCNFIIIARSTSGDDMAVRSDVSSVLNRFGTFAETLPGIYLLNASQRLSEIRRDLLAATDEAAQILIVEAPRGRLGWIGLPLDLDRHIRSIWDGGKTSPGDTE